MLFGKAREHSMLLSPFVKPMNIELYWNYTIVNLYLIADKFNL